MLTQAEIDALLAGSIEIEQSSSEGSVNLAQIMGQPSSPARETKTGPKIRPYNFWSPEHFTKDQMRAVELVHEDLAERLTNSLPPFVRSSLRPRVVHTEQGRFHDFLKDIVPGTLYHMITLAPLPGQMVMTISPEFSTLLLEQRLGGQGKGSDKTRPLTEIDQYLLRGMVEHVLNDIKASWGKVVAIEPNLEDSTVNQHWVQMMLGNERVMLITFELVLKDITGTMNIYIPFTMLKPISHVLNTHVWFSGRKERKTDLTARRVVTENITEVSLPVRVFLGHDTITFGQLSKLQVGSVIPLKVGLNAEFPVQIADRTCFNSRIGKSGKRLAAQITAKLDLAVPPMGPTNKQKRV